MTYVNDVKLMETHSEGVFSMLLMTIQYMLSYNSMFNGKISREITVLS